MSVMAVVALGAIALLVVALVVEAIPALVKVLLIGASVLGLLYAELKIYKGGL